MLLLGPNMQIYLVEMLRNYKPHNHQEAQGLIDHLHLGPPGST
jgi:hypothetical protein